MTVAKAYGTLAFLEEVNRWAFANLEPHVVIRLKDIFRRIPKEATGVITLANGLDVCADIAWFLSRYPCQLSDSDQFRLQDGCERFEKQAAELGRILMPDWKPGHFAFKEGYQPYPYQAQAAEILLIKRKLLLLDDVGTGKSFSAMAALVNDPTALPAAIVVPAHLAEQWQDEYIESATNLKAHIIKGTRPYNLPHADVYIFRYTNIFGWADIASRGIFRGLIWDEPQDLRRGQDTQKGRAAVAFRDHTTMRIGLSIGPENVVQLRGEAFGDGWIGEIQDAWSIAHSTWGSRIEGDYEIADAHQPTSTRGWSMHGGWCWKSVQRFIRHRCDKPMHAIKAGGRILTVTNDHSIFTAQSRQPETVQTDEISAAHTLMIDNGGCWGSPLESEISTEDIISGLNKIQAVVSLDGITRKDLGVSPQAWQNFHKEASYGPRLPFKLFTENRHRLPKPTGFYLGVGRAPYLPSHFKLSEMAYILGFFIGDGWLSLDETRIGFAVELARVDNFIERLRCLPVSVRAKTRRMSGASCEIRISHRLLGRLFKRLFGGAKCYDKRIPSDWIISWPEQARRELLSGLTDSDGHERIDIRNRSGFAYVTTSRLLASDVAALVCSLGGKAGIYVRKPAIGGIINGKSVGLSRIAYQVYWSGHQINGNTQGARGCRHRSNWTKGQTFEANVRSNNLIHNSEYVYDLEVDGHPSFSANGILVHNTATPIFNYGDEIWEVMQYIDSEVLGDRAEFRREWCTLGRGNHWIVNDPDALGTFLKESGVVLRRTEEDIGKQLPPVNTIVHEIQFDQDVVEAQEKRARMLAMQVIGGRFEEKGQAARELDSLTRHTTGVAKAPYVAAFVKILLDAKVPVLLGGWHREVYAVWNKLLADYHPLMYTGSESRTQKRKTKEAFLEGRSDLLMISLRSGVGLDKLQFRCSTCVHGEFDWSPQIAKQLYGRLRRPGQVNTVDSIYLWANTGSDPFIIETHGLKSSQARGIVDPLKGAEPVHTDMSRMQRLAESYLKNTAAVAAVAGQTDSSVVSLSDWRGKKTEAE